MPKRIQRKRTDGWTVSEGAVYVGRPSQFGNPFLLTQYPRAEAIRLYREMIERGEGAVTISDIRTRLRGKDLICWCPLSLPCHADVLLEVANGDTDRRG